MGASEAMPWRIGPSCFVWIRSPHGVGRATFDFNSGGPSRGGPMCYPGGRGLRAADVSGSVIVKHAPLPAPSLSART